MKSAEESERLKLFMEREGITQKDLVELIGKDQSEVSRIINGKIKVPLALVKKLHLKYKLNYTWFFHGTSTVKVKEIEKRKLMNDVTDILATQSMLMQTVEQMRDTINKLAGDFYAEKHK
jgi:transcriptional regulator with XRE-family HTH domain